MRHRFFSPLLPVLLLVLLLAGCELFGDNDEPTISGIEGVLVANGGNFGDQNGSLTFYDPATGETTTLTDLGGFGQSLALHEGRAYVAVNTFSEGRIEVIDLASGQRVGQIQGVPAPRYLAFFGGKAYATNFVFGSNGVVSVIDLATNTVTKIIEVGPSPEGIVAIGGRLVVANYGNLGDGNTLSVIDPATDTVVSTLDIDCDGPKDLFDGGGDVIVICQGKTVFNDDFTEILEQTNGAVLFVDPARGNAGTRIRFAGQLGSSNFTQSAYLAPEAGLLHVLEASANRIYRIDTRARRIVPDKIFTLPPADGLTGLTAVAYDAGAERLYVGRFAAGPDGAPDVTAAGAVVVLDEAGAQVERFAVGPAPSQIALR